MVSLADDPAVQEYVLKLRNRIYTILARKNDQ
jgi:hypothetical protein